MTDTTDRTPTEEQQDIRQDADRTDATRQDATVGVVEAAQLLGVTTDAVRARLRRGTLQGRKVEGEWLVTIPGALSDQQDATADRRDATEHRQDGLTERDRTPTVDLAPLTALIDDLTKRNADLAASTAFWQVRALQAEEQLKAITAGPDIADDAVDEPELAGEVVESPQVNEPEPTGIAAWWRRLWNV